MQLLGGACFSHGPYTFYKAVRIGNGRVLRLGSFFLTKLWSDADLVSIGELQLLWMDSRGPNQPLASLRLYFLPENTPDGRRDTHGEVSDFRLFIHLLVSLCRVSKWNYHSTRIPWFSSRLRVSETIEEIRDKSDTFVLCFNCIWIIIVSQLSVRRTVFLLIFTKPYIWFDRTDCFSLTNMLDEILLF